MKTSNKSLIVILAVSLFMVAIVAAGIVMFYPGPGTRNVADQGATEQAGLFDPIEYLRSSDNSDILSDEAIRRTDDRTPQVPIIIYPEPAAATAGNSAATAGASIVAGATTADSSVTTPATTAPSSPAAAQSKPTTATSVTIPTIKAAPSKSAAASRATASRATSATITAAPRTTTASSRQSAAAAARQTPAAPKPAAAKTAMTSRLVSATTKTPVAPAIIVRRNSNTWIQLISSPSRDRVERARRLIADQQLHGIIFTANINDQQFYRLRVGPFGNSAEAQKFLQWLQAIPEFSDSFIVKG